MIMMSWGVIYLDSIMVITVTAKGLKLIELDHSGFGLGHSGLGYYEWAELIGTRLDLTRTTCGP